MTFRVPGAGSSPGWAVGSGLAVGLSEDSVPLPAQHSLCLEPLGAGLELAPFWAARPAPAEQPLGKEPRMA